MENHPGHDLPPIVTDLLAHLRAHAMQTEGIFRRSANLAELRNIQAQVNRGECIKFVLYDVHLAAVLLKTFLRELSEPVMTYEQYNALLAVVAVPECDRIAAIRHILRQLPPENYRLLKAVVQFLTEVAAQSKHNLMDASNLSVVFGPNLAWPGERKVSLQDLHALNQYCYRLLTAHDSLFQ